MEFLPDLTTFVTFTIAVWVLAITPGPDMTLSIARSLSDGKAGGMMVVLGTSSGLVIHTLLVALGISALIVASPTAFMILKTGGAAYLVWLAVQAIRHGVEPFGQACGWTRQDGPGQLPSTASGAIC